MVVATLAVADLVAVVEVVDEDIELLGVIIAELGTELDFDGAVVLDIIEEVTVGFIVEVTFELAVELGIVAAAVVAGVEETFEELTAAGPTTPPLTTLGETESPVDANAAALYAARVLPLAGGLITPTMPDWQWEF